MKRSMSLLVAATIVLATLFVPLGLPPIVGGPTPAYAADGLAQLTIVSEYPIRSVTVSGANQSGDPVTWEHDYGEGSLEQEVAINDWWWRFKWYCPWWSLFCDEDDYPSPDSISPYVWVRYVDGTLEHKRCTPSADFNEETDWVTCEFSYLNGFSSIYADTGVELYRKDYPGGSPDFVQVADIGQGASVQLLHGAITDLGTGQGPYGGDNPSFSRQTLQDVWNDFAGSDSLAFCVTNGQFFSTNVNPTQLAFPLKRDGVVVSDGYGDYEYPGQKLMLEIWSDRANIIPFSDDALHSSSAPNIIVGLTENADKGPNNLVGRTFVGVDDANNDGAYERVLIFNSGVSTQAQAASVLRDFGADKVMMLDGGGSTQLRCNDHSYVESSDNRTIPQTIAVSKAAFIPPGSGEGFVERIRIFLEETFQLLLQVLPGQTHVTFSTNWPGSDVVMTLTTPSGSIIDRDTVAADVIHDVGATFETYTILNPEPGAWQVDLFGADVPPEGEDVVFRFTTTEAAPPPPPELAYVDGGTLVLNMGSEAHRNARHIQTDQLHEEFVVKQISAELPGVFSVTAFGLTQAFGGVERIWADGDDGNDIVLLQPGTDGLGNSVSFTAPAEIYGGSGDDVIESGDGADTLFGGPGNDEIDGGAGADSIRGDDGTDHIYGGGADDLMHGDAGEDYMEGNDGVDTMYGDDGNDEMLGGAGTDTMYGGAGDDVMHGNADNDLMEGNDGADTLYGDDGNDEVLGGAGTDTMYGGVGDDVMRGNADGDYMEGNDGVDIMYGDDGNDEMHGGAGADSMYGGVGDDFMHGDADDDYMEGKDGADAMHGDDGNDEMHGGAGVDSMYGGVGDDLMHGDAADDYMEGNDGADTMYGDDENDEMHGGTGVDYMYGVAGNDLMYGGPDDDYMEGNGGADTMYGDGGQDDLIGGTAVAGEIDGPDTMHGGAGHDVMVGDNASIIRPLVDGQLLTKTFSADATDVVQRVVELFDIAAVDFTPAEDISGGDQMHGDDGYDIMYGQGATDEMHGGAGDDYMEGNAASDVLYGDDGDDDMLGGTGPTISNDPSTALPGRIDASTLTRSVPIGTEPAAVVPLGDTMYGNSGSDVMLGDNGLISRPLDSNGYWLILSYSLLDDTDGCAAPRHTASGSGIRVDRDVLMVDTVPGLTAGSDFMDGGPGDDDLYGQFDDTGGLPSAIGDELLGSEGEDAIVGDLGVVHNQVLVGGTQTIEPPPPFFSDEVYVSGTLFREVTLQQVNTGGDDRTLGGPGADWMHGGAGNDLMNGNSGNDRLFGADGNDAMWGGPHHDHLWGGYGADSLDVKPSPEMEIGKGKNRTTLPADPLEWFAYADEENFQNIDYIYGGWGQDAMQADVGDTGPVPGDRLIDWAGAYNVYFLCSGLYGERVITRNHGPYIVAFLQDLAAGDGAVQVTTAGSSGFSEVAMVFSQDIAQNSHPHHPRNPGHFTCGY